MPEDKLRLAACVCVCVCVVPDMIVCEIQLNRERCIILLYNFDCMTWFPYTYHMSTTMMCVQRSSAEQSEWNVRIYSRERGNSEP